MKNMNNKRRIFFNTALVASAILLDKAVFFGINILVARYLNVKNFGEFTTALGYATFFSTFTNIGINNSLIRSINLEPDLEREHFANTLILKTVLATIVYVIMAGSLYFTGYNYNTMILVLILGLVRIGNEYLLAFNALFDAKEKFVFSSLFNISFSLTLLVSTIAVVILNGNYFHFAYVRLGVIVFIIGIILLYTLKKYTPRFNKETIYGFIVRTIPFCFSTIFSNLYQRIGIILLPLIHGTIYSGIFYNGFVLFSAILFIPGIIHRVLLPFLYKELHCNQRDSFSFAYEIFTKLFAILSFYIVIILYLFSYNIIVTIFSEKYLQSVDVLKTIVWGFPFVFSIAGTIIASLDKQYVNTTSQGVALCISIPINFIFIYYFKAQGAAIAIVLTNAIIFVITHGFLVKIGLIKFKKLFIIYGKLIAINILIFYFFYYVLSGLFFINGMIIVTILYIALVALFFLRKDEMKIIKEIIHLRE